MGDRNKLRRWLNWRTFTLAALLAGVGTSAFVLGRQGATLQAAPRPMQPVAASNVNLQPVPQPQVPAVSEAYKHNAVAYIYGSVPITREEFGEYLIARYGAERLEPFVNRRIIEHEAQKAGINITNAEIEADLADTVKNLKVTREDFEKKVLKTHGKNLYEWREDVVRPKLIMAQLCRNRVEVKEEEIRKCYEAQYGEKVKVQMILWPESEKNAVDKIWGEIRKDDKAFQRAAMQQASIPLARVGGKIDPFGRYTTGDEQLERMAFEQLQIGDVSPIMSTGKPGNISYIVIKLLERIPPKKEVKLDDVRAELVKEVIETKVKAEVPNLFAEMKKEADPRILAKKFETQGQLEREVKQDLGYIKPEYREPNPLEHPLPQPKMR